jgi:hypothetical protein
MEHPCSRSACQAAQKTNQSRQNPDAQAFSGFPKSPTRPLNMRNKSFIFWTIAARLSQNEAAKPWRKKQKSPDIAGLAWVRQGIRKCSGH